LPPDSPEPGGFLAGFYPMFSERNGLLLKNVLALWEIVCYTEAAFNNFFIIGVGNCSAMQCHKEENIMNWKRVISGVLAAAMLSALPVQLLASAEGAEAAAEVNTWEDLTSVESLEDSNTFYYNKNGYTFEKLSHPEKDVKTADGVVDYLGDSAVDVVTDPEAEGYNAGDRGQNYAWAAVGYGDWIYVGTCYAAIGNTLSLMKSSLGDEYDNKVLKATFDALYNGTFFLEEADGGKPKGVLVKINTKTGETKVLMSGTLNGHTPLFRNAIEYHGKLYFCGSVGGGGIGFLPSVWQVDPETDECKVVYAGLNSVQDYAAAHKEGISTGIRGMCVYQDQLVISNVTMDAATGKSSATLLISSDPEKGFTQIADSESLFNYPAYRYADSIYGGSIWDMVEYNNSLYVSICTGTLDNMPNKNTMQSFALVRGDRNADGTFTWTPVAGDQKKDGARYTFGIDPERTRSGAANLMVFNDYLYIGEYNDEEIALERVLFSKTGKNADGQFGGGLDCRFLNANLDQSVNLYRMDKNENMELVVGNSTKMFPNGSLSGLKSGFGRNENQYIWRMEVYDGKLYVGTHDASSLLECFGQFVNGNLLKRTPSEWKDQWNYLKALMKALATVDPNGTGNPDTLAQTIKFSYNFVFKNITVRNMASAIKLLNYLRTAKRGFDLYVTEDGVNFETITIDGFGDPYNHGLRVFATTDQGLCLGTANPFYGTQIWIQRKAD
jgi:hypothetical protein